MTVVFVILKPLFDDIMTYSWLMGGTQLKYWFYTPQKWILSYNCMYTSFFVLHSKTGKDYNWRLRLLYDMYLILWSSTLFLKSNMYLVYTFLNTACFSSIVKQAIK